jgi:hypothetical protein
MRIRWDEPPCPLCDGERRSPVLEAPDLAPGGSRLRFAVVRCDECGLDFTNPRPDRETIEQFYPQGHRPVELTSVVDGVMTLVDVLEHAHDPLAVLVEARRRLGPADRLIITVPNLESAAYRWFGQRWVGLDLPRHLTHFTAPTLRRMFERARFRVLNVRHGSRPDWLRLSALVDRSGQPSLWRRALTKLPVAQLAAWGCHLSGKSEEIIATAQPV